MTNNNNINQGDLDSWTFGKFDLTPYVRPTNRKRTGLLRRDHNSVIVVEGSGNNQLEFEENEVILADVMRVSELFVRQYIADARKQARAAARKAKKTQKQEPSQSDTDSSGTPNKVASEQPEPEFLLFPNETKGDPTLWVVSQGVLDVIRSRAWFEYVARFDEMSGSYNSARRHIADGRMEENLLWVVNSLDSHVEQLRGIYSFILPRAVVALKAVHPDVPSEVLAYCAAMALDNKFEGINNVVQMYALAFRQQMDGLYPVLDALRVFLQSAYSLFETGDPTGCVNCMPALNSRVFQAGARFLFLAGKDGPATISGGQELLKGPIGVHLGLVNFNELLMLLFELPVFTHENYHNIYWDVKDYAQELVNKWVKKATKWGKDKKFNFSTDHIMIGEQKVPILPFLISVIVQQMPEIVADLPGGVMFSGPAYWKAVFQLFIALNAGNRGVLNTDEGLRNDSVFELAEQEDGSAQLMFETHVPDYARALMLAAAYRKIGFPNDADQCLEYAKQANGWREAEFIEWSDANEQVPFTVKVKTSDFCQMFDPLIEVILFEKMRSLGNLSNADIVNWTQLREDKVQALVKMLVQLYKTGVAKLPEEIGDIYPHYFGSALTQALWELVRQGQKPKDVFARLNEPALKLMLELADQATARAKAEVAQQACDSDKGPTQA
ncbi:hypothetical protein BH10CYA1_BH10CYA1_53880 [soil metagenome]